MPRSTRRSFLRTSALVMASAPLAQRTLAGSAARRDSDVASVKALVFDVFGTVVDWRSSVADQVRTLASRKRLTIDGEKFADAWRAGYGPSMNRVRSGELPWTRLDDLHWMTLDRLLVDHGLTTLTEADKDALNKAWHRLQPWPDTVAALTRLKKK